MTALALLLLAKIVVSLFAIVGPFMLFSKAKLDAVASFGTPNLVFYRLYGMAILALVVAYSGGLIDVWQGTYPGTIVAMGLASNSGATLIMVSTGYARQQKAIASFFGLIAVGFLIAAIAPQTMMTRLF